MGQTRREMFRRAGALGAGLLVPGGLWGLSGCGEDPTLGELLESAGGTVKRFQVPLPQPPVLEPTHTDGGTDYYQLTAKAAKQEILPGKKTTVWGYNGVFPGPTIVSRSGRRSVVRHTNELPVPISVHLHGGHTPAGSDGYPTDVIVRAGESVPHHEGHADLPHDAWRISDGAKDYEYPLNQRGATLWYHDHRMDFTGPQVYRGLAGFHLVRDDEDDDLPLPKGDKELVLMITDRSFDADGEFRYPSIDPSLTREAGVSDDFHDGVLGDTILVNGAPWPFLEVSATRYRFRILNASNARRYALGLDPAPREGSPFVQVGSDGGLLAAPAGHDRIPIAQAERFDVVIDFGHYRVGDRVTLVNHAGDGKVGQIMRFHVTSKESDDSAIPATLSDLGAFEDLTPDRASKEREMEFSGGNPWEINKEPFDVNRIDADPKLGAVEIWDIHTNRHHPVHLHLVQFKVLERDDGIRKTDRGWKDTLDLGRSENARVIARFTDYPGRYVFHCHNLEHEDMAMMANVEVV